VVAIVERAANLEQTNRRSGMKWSPDRNALRGRVAVVAGATRGAGRGIAAALGEAGATVVCTGRSSRTTSSTRSDYDRPETIEETAELVTRLGGMGIAAAVDHLDSDQVKTLAEQIQTRHGHIDVLVNDIWGGELLKGGPAQWNTPIWKHDLAGGLRILRLAIETHLITSHHLLPLLIEKPGGLLVEVTDGTTDYNATHYRISVFYDLAKVAINRLAFSQGHELAPHGATAVAVTPGWLRSEMMLDNFGVSEENWRDAIDHPAPSDFALSESPRYVGRAVVALASDPDRARWHQKSVSSGQLAREYGFIDVDGSRPDIWRYIEEVLDRGLGGKLDEYR
jgi:NAD(P)-dependent dehydrogenase (short-subunit alcohol dehydrogenase family)